MLASSAYTLLNNQQAAGPFDSEVLEQVRKLFRETDQKAVESLQMLTDKKSHLEEVIKELREVRHDRAVVLSSRRPTAYDGRETVVGRDVRRPVKQLNTLGVSVSSQTSH